MGVARQHRRRDNGRTDQGRSACLAARPLLVVGDAGMYSADNLAQLSRGLGRYILAVPMRRVRDIEDEVLTRPGRYEQVADNLQVKEVWLGDGGDLLGLWANTNDGEFSGAGHPRSGRKAA